MYLTEQPAPTTLPERDRPPIKLTRQMVEAGEARLADIEGSSSAYQAREVFLAMAEAGGLAIRVEG